MNSGWPPEGGVLHLDIPRRACAEAKKYMPTKSRLWNMTWVTSATLPIAQSPSILFFRNLLVRIPSDEQLWQSSRIHRTLVTFVTLVLFHSFWLPEGGVLHLVDFISTKSRGICNYQAPVTDWRSKQYRRCHRVRSGHIDPVEVGKGTGGSPRSCSTNVIQRNPLQGSPGGGDASGEMAFHLGNLKTPGSVCLQYSINSPMWESLFRQGAALPVPSITDKQSICFAEFSHHIDVPSENTSGTQQPGIMYLCPWLRGKNSQANRLVNMKGWNSLKKEGRVGPQSNPWPIRIPSYTVLGDWQGMELTEALRRLDSEEKCSLGRQPSKVSPFQGLKRWGAQAF